MMNKSITVFKLVFFWVVTGASGQIDYDSHDNYTGIWLDDNAWVDVNVAGGAPQNPSHPTNSQANSIDVFGYITRQGDLTINNANPVVTVYDTLVIDGNTVLGSMARMSVPAGGLLVVTGNLRTQGAFELGNSGRVVVGGDVVSTNGTITNNQDFYVLGTTSVTNAGNIGGCEPWLSCDPATAANIGDESDLNANDPSLAGFVSTLGVLPVELAFFKAREFDNKVVLQWSTASELNNDYFDIQRSVDGVNFDKLGTVGGNGTTYHTIQYHFADQAPLRGVNYYRLKQFDFDGSFAYSPLIRVFFETGDTGMKVYPNPAADILRISLDHRFINTKTQLKLYDAKGQLSLQEDFIPTQMISTFGLEGIETPGIYMLYIGNGSFEEFTQVLVSR